MKKKLLSLLVAACMVLSVIPAGLTVAHALIDDYYITLGDNRVECSTYCFCPAKDGEYAFIFELELHVDLTDIYGNTILSGDYSSFAIELNAYEDYYIEFDFYDDYEHTNAGVYYVADLALESQTVEDFKGIIFRTVPDADGFYSLFSISSDDGDPYIALLSKDFVFIGESDNDPCESTAAGEYDFCLNAGLNAGETYYLIFNDYDGCSYVDLYVDVIDTSSKVLTLGDNELEVDETNLAFLPKEDGFYVFTMQVDEGVSLEMLDEEYVSYPYTGNSVSVTAELEAGQIYYAELKYHTGPSEEENLVLNIAYSDKVYTVQTDGLSNSLMLPQMYSAGIMPGETVYFFNYDDEYAYENLFLVGCDTGDEYEVTSGRAGSYRYISFVMPAENLILCGTERSKNYSIEAITSVVTVQSCADEGETVYFYTDLNNAFKVISYLSVSYIDLNNHSVELEIETEGCYCYFTMPAADVIITYESRVAEASDAVEMTLGRNVLGEDTGTTILFAFTPEETGTYTFTSDIWGDPYGFLTDSTFNELEKDDDSETDMNFDLSYFLKAGETYYLGIRNRGTLIRGSVTAEYNPPAALRSHALVLSGEIGVIFNIGVDADINVEGAYAEFKTGRFGTQKAYLSNLYSGEYTVGSRYFREFSCACYVGAYRMADKISATLHLFVDDEEITVEFEPYSVQDYLEYVIGNPGDYSDEMSAIAMAINDYGYYSQQYLSELHGYTLGDSGKYAAMSSPYTEGYNYDDMKAYLFSEDYTGYSINKDDNAVESVSFSLNLESKISMYLYITVKDGVVPEIACNPRYEDEEYSIKQISDNVYRVEISGLNLVMLGAYMEVTVKDAGGNEIVRADISPMNYIYLVLDRFGDNADNAALCDTVCALVICYNMFRNYIENDPIIIGPEPEP